MKLESYRKDFEFFSGKASDLSRNLSFMGFGAVWILIGSVENLTSREFDTLLIWVMILLTLSLSFDLLQYIYQTLMTFFLMRKYEKKDGVNSDIDYDHRTIYNLPGDILFTSKIALMVAAYTLLVIHLFKLIF